MRHFLYTWSGPGGENNPLTASSRPRGLREASKEPHPSPDKTLNDHHPHRLLRFASQGITERLAQNLMAPLSLCGHPAAPRGDTRYTRGKRAPFDDSFRFSDHARTPGRNGDRVMTRVAVTAAGGSLSERDSAGQAAGGPAV